LSKLIFEEKTTMKTIHLTNDLKIQKSTMKRIIKDSCEGLSQTDIVERKLNVVQDLLNRRGLVYSLDEAQFLIDYYLTSHDECVMENEEDYNALDVYRAKSKEKKLNEMKKIIQNIS